MPYFTWASSKANALNSQSVVDQPSFRAWAQDLHAQLLANGLVLDTVSSAAQADLTTATCPAAVAGTVFKIYELNDSLSGAFPIYIKVAFGGIHSSATYPTIAAYPQCMIQTGTTVDAAGNLGGLVSDVFRTVYYGAVESNSNTATSNNLIVKAEGFFMLIYGYAQMGGQNSNPVAHFMIERLPDDSGNLSGAGYTIVRPWISLTNSVNSSAAYGRTITTSNSGQWNLNPGAPLGGAMAASADGALQFQRFYHISPKLLPMRGLMLHYQGVVPAGANFVVNADGGGPRRYKSLGAAGLDNQMHADGTDTAYHYAVLLE